MSGDPTSALRLAAEQMRREGREEEAIVTLRRALGVAPKDLDLLLALAGCLMDLDRRREALPIFKAALDVDPNRADAQYGAGECLATLGAVDEAQAATFQAIVEKKLGGAQEFDRRKYVSEYETRRNEVIEQVLAGGEIADGISALVGAEGSGRWAGF